LRERPVAALLSGPAAGVSGAVLVASETGWTDADLLTIDVGGTSADIGVIRAGRAVLSSEEHVRGLSALCRTSTRTGQGVVVDESDGVGPGTAAGARKRGRSSRRVWSSHGPWGVR